MMNIIFLSMLDSNTHIIIAKLVVGDLGIVTIPSPNAIVTFKNRVLENFITAECYFNTVCRRIRKIISKNNIIITTSLATIHSCLTRPQKKAIAAVRNRVFVKQFIITLLIDQNSRTILSPAVYAITVSPYIEINFV